MKGYREAQCAWNSENKREGVKKEAEVERGALGSDLQCLKEHVEDLRFWSPMSKAIGWFL